MKRTGANNVVIAAALNVDPVTVKRFLAGRRVRPIVEEALRRLVNADDPGGQKAAVS